MTKLTVLTPADKLAEIKRLYFVTTRQTIDADLSRAVQLLTSMNTEEERERARVFMDGLAQMRSDWARSSAKRAEAPQPGTPSGPGRPGKPGMPSGKARQAGRLGGRDTKRPTD